MNNTKYPKRIKDGHFDADNCKIENLADPINALDAVNKQTLDNGLDLKVDVSHTHLELDITDLDHDAQKIKGVIIDDTNKASGKILKYNSTSGKLEYTTDETGAGAGIDTWYQSYVLNTPSTITRIFGKSTNGFNPGKDIRILALHIQFYSEHPTQSKLRVRVFRYDAIATTDREILNIAQVGVAKGYHNVIDNSPDTAYYDLDSSAGDTIWVEIDDGVGSSANRVKEITLHIKYQEL